MIILLGKMALVALLFFGLCGACSVCQGLFSLPLDGIGKLCSVIVALPGYALYYYSEPWPCCTGYTLSLQPVQI